MKNLLFYIFLLTVSFYGYQLNASFVYNTDKSGSQSERGLYKTWFEAVRKGDISVIKDLANKIDINQTSVDCYFNTLMMAAQHGHEEIVKFVLKIPGIKINDQVGPFRWTALYFAASNGHENILKLLLELPGIDINAMVGYDGITALLEAIEQDQTNIVNILLKTPGIIVNPYGKNIFVWAVKNKKKKIYNYFLNNIDINHQYINGQTVLMSLVNVFLDNPWIDIIKQVLAYPDLDINAQDNEGNTALMIAAINSVRGTEIIELLLSVPGININIQNKEGKNAIMILDDIVNAPPSARRPRFSKAGYVAAMQLFIKINKEIAELAFQAIQDNNFEALKKAVAQIGVDHIKEAEGNTLLDKAFEANRPAMILFLLQNAKDPQELLGRFPFESINPTSDVFKFMVDLAYPTTKVIDCDTSLIETSPDAPTIGTSGSSGRPQPADDTLLVRTSDRSVETPKLCTVCLQRADQICSKCKEVYYCSSECQKADWKNHKHNCVTHASS